MNGNIRPVVPEDLPDLKVVIKANDLFPEDMLDDLTLDYFQGKNKSELWFTYEDKYEDEKSIAIAYCAPEKMTEGTWNLYLIAVHPNYQRHGIGTAILSYIEQKLALQGERVLLVETSGLESFEGTRAFYRKRGYEQEARIREFYQAGEDKIIFRKSF